MRRLVLIAAAVLVPFGLLVAWGLAALREEPVVVPPIEAPPPLAAVAEPEPAPARPRPSPAAPPLAPVPLEPAPAPAPLAPPSDEATIRTAVVEQLTPVVNLCFLEMNDRLKRAIRISATFETGPDGSLNDVRIKMKSADPYVVACVQDALEGALLDKARGLPNGPMRHTFTFNPEAAK